jgi:hypothetical protein
MFLRELKGIWSFVIGWLIRALIVSKFFSLKIGHVGYKKPCFIRAYFKNIYFPGKQNSSKKLFQ